MRDTARYLAFSDCFVVERPSHVGSWFTINVDVEFDLLANSDDRVLEVLAVDMRSH